MMTFCGGRHSRLFELVRHPCVIAAGIHWKYNNGYRPSTRRNDEYQFLIPAQKKRSELGCCARTGVGMTIAIPSFPPLPPAGRSPQRCPPRGQAGPYTPVVPLPTQP
jgi:hypothetical protein